MLYNNVMKIIFIIFLIFIKINLFAQISNDDNFLARFDIEYSKLYNELFEIIKNDFQPPIVGEILFSNNNFSGYAYGLLVDPFTGMIKFSNCSFLYCDENENIYSMTSGIIKNIILERMVIIEYNGIELYYRDLNIDDNIIVGNNVVIGQLLGTRKGFDAYNNYFEGLILKIKYKEYFFDIGFIYHLIKILND